MVLYMLDDKTIKKVIEFVQRQPRTVQEIAQFLSVNWRTADRYVQRITEETGSLASRTFREGTRGALKIVYYNANENIASTEFQERLLLRILAGRKKEDFSPLDIYQYADEKKRRAFVEVQAEEYAKTEQDIIQMLNSAQKQIMIFSGNLSWANVVQGRTKVIDVLAEVAKTVPIKILTRVDVASIKNIQKVSEINTKLGREAIEIRHAEQPLRCIIIDDKHSRLKEVKQPESYKKGELARRTYLFYDIYDADWVQWLQKVFWHIFRAATPASTRMRTLNSIQKIRLLE